MKPNILMLAVAGYALAALTSVAIAAAPTAATKATTMKCPACNMPMPTKKSASMTVPVKVGKATYYCCPMCSAGKKAAAAAHKKA